MVAVGKVAIHRVSTGGSGTFYIRKYQPGTITLDVTGSTPPARPFSTNLCQIGSGGWSADNCDLVFSDSGFEIDVPDKYAAEAVEVTIKPLNRVTVIPSVMLVWQCD